MKSILGLPVVLLFLGSSSTARAQDSDLPLEMEYKSVLVAGQDKPCIRFNATATHKTLAVTLSREGKRQGFKLARMAEGQSKVFCWKEAPGRYQYTLDIRCTFEGQARRRTVDITLSYLPPLQILLSKERIDLDHRKLTFQINHWADKAELQIQGRGGTVMTTASQSYGGADPGTPLELAWDALSGEIARMDLKVFDTDGNWAGMAITPWLITIPHEEVVFETDKWVVRESEAPKLDAAIKQIHKALTEHPSEFQVKLYVAGFTDTVGGQGHNRTLSTNRAQAIAQYFRHKGVSIPILYRGFGEEVLAVGTPDNKDEPRNRRALYVLGGHAPVIAESIGWGDWKALK